jgi:hypothetical protein
MREDVMKETNRQLFFPVVLAMACVAAPVYAGPPDNSINFGVGGMPRTMPHCAADVYSAEYERAFSDTNTVLFRASAVNYRFDNGTYQENGSMRGLDIGARRYRGGRMQGLFMGGSLGVWASDWTFLHVSGNQGTATSYSSRLNLEFGDRIVITGTNISLMPEINIGKFFWSSSCNYTAPAALVGTPCNQKSEVDAYLFVGLLAGATF